MYGPEAILSWMEQEVKPMRRSRRKTLSVIVAAAMKMRGVGVLALGRAVESATTAKHAIKRVWRFFRNERLEVEAIQQALVNHLLPPNGRRVVLLVDWTDHGGYKTLVAALPRDGRSLPVWWATISKESGEGVQRRTEQECLAALKRRLPFVSNVVIVADRGFGNTRWLADVEKWGWGYVQRLTGTLYAGNDRYFRALNALPLFRGGPSRDWGTMALTQDNPFPIRLVTAFDPKAKEPWFLATNLNDLPPEIVRIYQRRMWIEEMFRDLKNRNWGLGLTESVLSSPARQDRLWSVLALTYLFLCAFGAAAEKAGLDRHMRQDTGSSRAMNLARLGNYFLQIASLAIPIALAALNALPP